MFSDLIIQDWLTLLGLILSIAIAVLELYAQLGG